MKILFLHYNHSLHNSLQQIYMRKTFEDLGHKVTTAGRSEKNAPKLDFEFKSPIVSIKDILAKTKRKFDLIFLFHLTPNFWISDIEKSPVPTALYLFDTHISFNKALVAYANLFDYVFCAQYDFVNKLKKDGHKNVFWSPCAVYPKIIKKHNLRKIYDVIFVGMNNPLHNPRRAIYLKFMKEMAGLKIIKNKYLSKLAKIHSQSKIVFNIPVYNDLNFRVFETLACQSLLITHRNQLGLHLLFKDKVHLITYSNIFDAIRKIKYYLEHDREREKIAKAGYQEVHKNHTYKKRIKEILSRIQKNKAPKRTLSSNLCFKVAKSHYIAAAIDQTIYWLKVASQKAQNSTIARAKYIFFSKIVKTGGQPLHRRLVFLYAKQAGLRAIIWQFRNF